MKKLSTDQYKIGIMGIHKKPLHYREFKIPKGIKHIILDTSFIALAYLGIAYDINKRLLSIVDGFEKTTTCVKNECTDFLSSQEVADLILNSERVGNYELLNKAKKGDFIAYLDHLPSEEQERNESSELNFYNDGLRKFISLKTDLNESMEIPYAYASRFMGVEEGLNLFHMEYFSSDNGNILTAGGIDQNASERRVDTEKINSQGAILLRLNPIYNDKKESIHAFYQKTKHDGYDNASAFTLGTNKILGTNFSTEEDDSYNCNELPVSALHNAGILPAHINIDNVSAKDLIASGVLIPIAYTEKGFEEKKQEKYDAMMKEHENFLKEMEERLNI